ncbi:MAG: hypothetical protein FJ202_01455 [Gemmatimonadetes bacterium]|uniref:Uncharacterized protein n=1 Tax=Candidatus Tanganyikabacteria bacterium TaxID=2961651 RepID=A0A937X9N1_9BACT|nr:hypothetical protein [Candidatus Tanganyikabacteria bacterium]MBM4193031.1 hypothetical protein [Gemmatimonadota bacterium]
MLKTLFSVGLATMAGIVLLKLVFGLFGGFVMLLFWILGIALKILLVGAAIYFILRIISPDTARKMTDSFSGTSGS